MAGTNKTLRRAIPIILWRSSEPLTKEEIMKQLNESSEYINVNPTSASMGSILNNNPQVVKVDTIRVFCGDGRWRRKPRFGLNRSLIRERSDIVLTLPANALYPDERARATMCLSCSRHRIKPDGSDECLECARTEG